MKKRFGLKAVTVMLVVALVGAIGHVLAQTFNPPAPVTVVDVTASSVELHLPALPGDATSFSLQRATIIPSVTEPPASGRTLWLRADSISGVGNGGTVAQWGNMDGLSAASQSNTAARPTLITGVVGGRPVVRFDGADDYLQLPTGMRNFSQGLSAFVVGKPSVTNNARYFDFGNGNYNDAVTIARWGSSTTGCYAVWNQGNMSYTLGDDTFNNSNFSVATVIHQGGTPSQTSEVNLYNSGALTGTGQATVPRVLDRTTNYIGKSNYASDALLQGDIAEILIYNRAVDTTERQDIEAYLSTKYSLSSGLGATNWTTIASNLGAGASYTDTTVSADTVYSYRCVAVNQDGTVPGKPISVRSLPLASEVPSGPAFGVIASTWARLGSFTLPARATHLALQQKLATEPTSSYATVAQVVAPSHIVSGLAPQTQYNFRFVAVGEGGQAIGPEMVLTTQEQDPPSPPEAPHVTAVSPTAIHLRLPALPARATNFKLQRALASTQTGYDFPLIPTLWVKADAVSGTSAYPLAFLPDAGFDNYDIRQNAVNARPQWVPGVANGHPVIRFDGQDDFLTIGAGLKNFSNGLTAFVVARPTSSGEYARFLDFGNAPGSNNILFCRVGQSDALDYGIFNGGNAVSTNAPGGIVNGSLHSYSVLQKAGAPNGQSLARLFRDGQQIAQGQNNVPPIIERTQNFIGRSNWWWDAMYKGDIAEVMIYQTALSETQRASIERYLSQKYAFNQTLPSTLQWQTIAQDLAGETSYIDGGRSPKSIYWYRCVATSPYGDTEGEAQVAITSELPPAVPDLPVLERATATTLQLQLPAMPARANRLVLERKLGLEDDKGYVAVASSDSGSTSVNVDKLQPHSSYSLRVVAHGEGGSTVGAAVTATTQSENPGAEGLTAQYFGGTTLDPLVLTRIDPNVDFNWGYGSPEPGKIYWDDFSARWVGQIEPLYNETYTFFVNASDGARLWIDGQAIIGANDWIPGSSQGQIALQAGHKYNIRLEYVQYRYTIASIQLLWQSASQPKQVVPPSQLTPLSHGNGTGLTGRYFEDETFQSLVFRRQDAQIDCNWGWDAPGLAMPSDHFSVRWTGEIEAILSENTTFSLDADDGARLWLDNQLVIDGLAGGGGTGSVALTAGQRYSIKIEYREGTENARVRLFWQSTSLAKALVSSSQLYPEQAFPTSLGNGTGLQGNYFNNRNLSASGVNEQQIFNRLDPTINFEWGRSSPGPKLQNGQFSVRWKGQIQPLYSETYRFVVDAHEGCRLWVNNMLLVDRWNLDRNFATSPNSISGTIALQAGQKYDIRLEYFDMTSGLNPAAAVAGIKLFWSSESQQMEIVPKSQLFASATPALALGNGTGLFGSYYNTGYHYSLESVPYLNHNYNPPQTCYYRSFVEDPMPILYDRVAESRVDPTIDFDWGDGLPSAYLYSQRYSIRWKGQIQPLYSQTYTFKAHINGGLKIRINGQEVLDDWEMEKNIPEWRGSFDRTTSGTIALEAGQKYSIEIEYWNKTNNSRMHLYWSSASQPEEIVPKRQLYPTVELAAGGGGGNAGLNAAYYENANHSNLKAMRTDPGVNFDWGTGAPVGVTNPDTFSVRWTGYLHPSYSENFTFYADTNDIVRLWVDGVQLINTDTLAERKFGTRKLTAGRPTPIMVEFVESSGEAHLNLQWSSSSQEREVIPSSAFSAYGRPAPQILFDACAGGDPCSPCPEIPPIYDAVVRSVDVPSQVVPGQTFIASVTMQNSGSSATHNGELINKWTVDQFVLATFSNQWGSSSVSTLPGGIINPGDTNTFQVTMVAPTTPGTYVAQWGMIRSTIRPFGEVTHPIYIHVVPSSQNELSAPTVLTTTSNSTTLRMPLLPALSEHLVLQRFHQPTPDQPTTQGLQVWLDAQRLKVADRAPVASWPDVSGHNHHATQVLAAQRPRKQDNSINGRAAVVFNGQHEHLLFTEQDHLRSVFLVLKHRTGSTTKADVMLGINDNRRSAFETGPGSQLLHPWWASAGVRNGQGFVNSASVPPLDMKLPADFQLLSFVTSESIAANMLGSGLERPLQSWDGQFAEVLLYDRVLSNSERRDTEVYLTAKYGFSTSYEPAGQGTWETIASNLSGEVEYTDSDLNPGETYWYRCLSVGEVPLTGHNAHTTTLVPVEAPEAPGLPTFSDATPTQVTAHAPALPARANYLLLQRKLSVEANTAFSTIANSITGGADTIVKDLDPDTTYSFRFIAVNEGGQTVGEAATWNSAAKAPERPNAPTFDEVGMNALTVILPKLPLRADSLTLQIQPPGQTEYVTVEEGLDGESEKRVENLAIDSNYLFRCIAVGDGGQTMGLAASITTNSPAPEAPERPTFSNLSFSAVTVTAPALPNFAVSLQLQVKPAGAADDLYVVVAQEQLGGASFGVVNLQPGISYEFRYVAVNYSGRTPGLSRTITMPIPVVTWYADAAIECAGIRFPEPNAAVSAGAVVRLSSFLATDFDRKELRSGAFVESTKHSDVCTYTWSSSAGAFQNAVAFGQNVFWQAPATPGTYTIDLVIDDQGGANARADEAGTRADGANDAPLHFSTTITVMP